MSRMCARTHARPDTCVRSVCWPAADWGGQSGKLTSQIRWRLMWLERGAMRGGTHATGRRGIGGLLGGRLPTLCAPNPRESVHHCGFCLFKSQRAERGDFSSTEPMTSKLFFSFFFFPPFCFFLFQIILSGVSLAFFF